jgi:hypothetical protein
MVIRLLLILAVLVALGSTDFADVGSTKLETLIDGSDLVVLGKVVSVTAVGSNGFKIAEVEITQTLRGQTESANLRYIATPMTDDDASDAQLGESALLFLRRLSKPPSEYSADVRKITRGEPLFFIAHAGRGRLVPVRINGDDYVYFRLGRRILLPPKLSALWKQDPKDPSLGLVRLNDLLDFIKQYSRRASDSSKTTVID